MPTLRHVRNRLSKLAFMDRAELLDRARQAASKRVDAALGSFGFQFSAGEVGAGLSGDPQYFFSHDSLGSIVSLLRERFPLQTEQIVRDAFRTCVHRFDLLGYRDVDYGERIDWHYDPVHGKKAPLLPFFQVPYFDYQVVGDVKVIWELNRHQHFITLAKAYRLTGDERFSQELLAQWRDWRSANPYPLGVNWASSLEVAFRSLSWLWSYFLLKDTDGQPHSFQAEMLEALALNARHIERYLSTYSSPNTHLLGEAVALFFTGTLCPQLRSAQRWKSRGWSIILREAQRQVRSDGFHFEQSTYYHVYALDFLLHSTILAIRNRIAIPEELERTLTKMLDVLRDLCEGGHPPRLGDDDGGRVFDGRRNRSEHLADPLATGAVLFAREDWKSASRELPEETLWLLGEAGVSTWDRLEGKASTSTSAAFEESGLYCMSDPDNSRLVINAGPRRPLRIGHAHADILSLSLRRNGKDLLVDPGTFAYSGADNQRNRFRGTAAHNTLQVDLIDQAEPEGAFGWASFPKSSVQSWVAGEYFDFLSGSHDGYSRSKPGIVHRRSVFSMKSKFFFVRDVAEGAGEHRLDQYWHLGPGLSRHGRHGLTFHAGDGTGLTLVPPTGCAWSTDVFLGSCSPAYGVREPALVVKFEALIRAPAEFAVALLPASGANMQAGILEMRASRHPNGVRAYRYRTTVEEYLLCFGSGGTWRFGRFESDAAFFCIVSAAEVASMLLFCDGSFVNVDGKPVVQCATPVKRCEIQVDGNEPKIFASEPDAVGFQGWIQRNGT